MSYVKEEFPQKYRITIKSTNDRNCLDILHERNLIKNEDYLRYRRKNITRYCFKDNDLYLQFKLLFN